MKNKNTPNKLIANHLGWKIVPFFHYKDREYLKEARGNDIKYNKEIGRGNFGDLNKHNLLVYVRWNFIDYFSNYEIVYITLDVFRVYKFADDDELFERFDRTILIKSELHLKRIVK